MVKEIVLLWNLPNILCIYNAHEESIIKNIFPK